MKMHSTGYETKDYGLSAPASEETGTRTIYPELHLVADEDGKLPKMPDGEFYIIAKVKKTGFRAPMDSDGKASVDLAVLGICPCHNKDIAEMAGDEMEMDGDDANEDYGLDDDLDDEPAIKRGFRAAMMEITGGKGANEEIQVMKEAKE